MDAVTKDTNLVAYCGLYCGACRRKLGGHCPGCRENEKATWCKLRTCCIDNSYSTCADCRDFTDVNECKLFNNLISKMFAFIFRSNRKACIEQIRDKGIEGHAGIMTGLGRHSLGR